MKAKLGYIAVLGLGLGLGGMAPAALAMGFTNQAEVPQETDRAMGVVPQDYSRGDADSGKKGAKGAQAKTPEEIRYAKVAGGVQSAHELLGAGKIQEALVKLSELDAVTGKNADENYLIERTRLAIASRVGDNMQVVKSAEAVLATGKAATAEQIELDDMVARAYFNQKNYPQAIAAIKRYFKDGGSDPAMRLALVRSYYASGNNAEAAVEALAMVDADERAGRQPSEEALKLWFSAATKQNNQADHVKALERLTAYYPKSEYWADLLGRLVAKTDFADRYSFDVYRLMYATGQIRSADEYVGMAQAALQAGYTVEAKRVLDRGFETGVLGTGVNAAVHKRLQEQAAKGAATEVKDLDKAVAAALKDKNGSRMVELGYRLANAGDAARGVDLIEQGFRTGGLKNADDAKLRLGIAYLMANRKEDAMQALKSVEGLDGARELAKYWSIHLRGSGKGVAPQAGVMPSHPAVTG